MSDRSFIFCAKILVQRPFAENIDLKQLQNDLGHKKLETTQIYTKSLRKDRSSLQIKMLEGLNQLM